jgi:uncharacterized RDD family membrane protein YckC
MTADDRVRIETPEHVVFEYELAGLGSRILAALIDLLLVGLFMLGIFLVIMLFGGGIPRAGPWAVAFGLVAAFLTLWGYPIFFEILWKGQTPGKRSLKMRVIQEGGYTLTPQVVIVRNLLRLVDFLPGGYCVGLLSMIFNARYKRVGDWVAGTIVIRDRSATAAPPPRRQFQSVPQGQEEKVAELRRAGVHRLDAAQVQLIREFLERRVTLQSEARIRLADQLARTVSGQLQIPVEHGERFLQCVLAAHSQDDAEDKPQP